MKYTNIEIQIYLRIKYSSIVLFSGYIVENQNYSRTVIITQCLFAKNVRDNNKILRIWYFNI